MSDEPKKRRSRGWIGWTLLLAFVLYPVSMGPVWQIASDETVFAVYAPLCWASEHCEPFHEAMNLYLRLWGRGIYFLVD